MKRMNERIFTCFYHRITWAYNINVFLCIDGVLRHVLS